MNATITGRTALVVAVCLTPLLSACAQSSLRIAPDFGNAVNQDLAAQIADPDAHYAGTPAPGSNGLRVGLAQGRYDTNQVIQPATTTASGAKAENGPGGGAGASTGGGMGASAGVSQ